MKILIIGGGAAGLSAAVTAAEAGASVELWECLDSFGGNGRFAEGVFAAGSALQKRLNIDADPAKIFREAMDYAHWRSDARLTRALIDASGETVDWLCSLGVPFSRVIHHMINQSPEVFHMTPKTPTGRFVVERLESRCRELGVKMRVGMRAKMLCMNGGRVCGVEAENGEVCEADAVLIATGGMAGAPERIRSLLPGFVPEDFRHFKGLYHAGDGLELAKQAGAQPCADLAIEGAGPVFFGRGPVGAIVRSEAGVWVNLLGERFCDESIALDFIFGQNAVARQPEKRCFVLFDDETVRRFVESAPSPMADADAVDNGFSMLPQAVENAVAEGTVLKGASVAELATAMGVDAAALEQTVREFNAACKRGVDAVFAKPARCLFPLDTGCLYAAKAGLDMITVHGGVPIDWKMRVLGEDYRPVPGLYCAGIDASGTDSGDYSVTLSGHAFGFSLAGGRLAVKNMME